MPVFSRHIEKLLWDHKRRGDDPWTVAGRLYEQLAKVRAERNRLRAEYVPPVIAANFVREPAPKPVAAADKQAVVYYVEQNPGGLIKIGRSVRLEKRLTELRCGLPDLRLLAVELGGKNTEARRHRQFARLRKGGEWFRPHRTLLEHIDRLRREAGNVS